MADYGIKISTPGVDARTATDLQLLLNMKYPIAKLDTTNVASFQDVTLTFATDPPEPGAGNTNSTTVYSYAHGYTYVPQLWSMLTVTVPPTSQPIQQPYSQEFIVLSQKTPVDIAILRIRADATNITYIVEKSQGGAPVANPLQPCVVKVRTYVFVQDITS